MKSTIPSWSAALLMSMLLTNARLYAQGQELPGSLWDNIIISSHTNNIDFFDKTSKQLAAEEKRVGLDLIKVLGDSKSSNLDQCAAAYYLGEIRYADAVGVLAAHINLRVDLSVIKIKALYNLELLVDPALCALIKIGAPSVPALIHILEENDDLKVRDLALKALLQIDGDKDILLLHLQKTSNTQSDPVKKARLKMALNSMAGPSTNK